MPINLATINSYFNTSLKPYEVSDFIHREIEREHIKEPRNFEEQAISLVGRRLYEAFIRGYTLKQWETDPRLLPAGMFNRIPLRKNYDAHYFNDPWQGIPLMGYRTLMENILSHRNITLQLNTDYFQIRNSIPSDSKVIYSGPIDRFFDYKFGRLGWRTSYFEKIVHNCCDFQGTSVVNYAEEKYDFTRIHEFKHYHPEREQYEKSVTVLFKEYSKFTEGIEDPYYPINTPEDRKKYKQYLQLAEAERNVTFGGRLGSYRYLNMDEAIGEALEVFRKLN
jgi:UDP-galactopyranose mutase